MPRKTSTIPVLKPDEPAKGGKKPVGRLQFKRVAFDTLPQVVLDLCKEAKEKGWNPETGRGTITLY